MNARARAGIVLVIVTLCAAIAGVMPVWAELLVTFGCAVGLICWATGALADADTLRRERTR